jgi:uroporphyrin-III C-methyltransferase/precorrin-2 dehydrogenase/sirohydrochlorin ferrochelatase
VKHLPLFFDLAGRRVVVVGSSPAARRRAELARSAGAAVYECATVSSDDLRGSAAVFVATGNFDRDLDGQRAANAAGIPVNVADRPQLSDFILPAIVDRDDVVVAISTGGASPTLATLLRGRIEAMLPARFGAVAKLARTFRGQANALIEPERRRAFWRRLIEGPAAWLALRGDEAGARRIALTELDAARHESQPLGIAHIVGAGPGDPDLLTLKAAQLLQQADVVLHDALVPEAILDRARREAELICVGKRAAWKEGGRASWAQSEIEAEMIRRVRAGQTVVRLKAGDPFVFGRGGEEVDALQAAGLPVTVIPGITAALGCAASVGIALTDRRVASSVTFSSGHAAHDAAGGHTHVLYMAISEAAAVRDRLLADGVDPSTPVAIVESGTRPDERVSTGRLADLARLAIGHGAGPSLIIVGEVAARAAADRPSFAEVS